MNYEQLILVFTSIIYEALPFVVLGVIIAGILEEFVPQTFISAIFEGRVPTSLEGTILAPILRPFITLVRVKIIAIMLGGLLGLIFPMCECGIIPIMRRLVRKGVPLSVCVCYLLCGPIINVVVLLSTYVAFKPPLQEDYVLGGPAWVVALRAGLAFIIGCVTALVVDRLYQKHGDSLLLPIMRTRSQMGADNEGTNGRRVPLRTRLSNIAETALHDFVDIMAFLILGAALAAVGRNYMAGTNFQSLIQDSPAIAIAIMMGIAVLFCLCSEADAFVAANFSPIWPPAAKLAFMVLGPMMDIKLYIMYTRIFRPRLIWTIILCVVVQVFLYTLAVHYLWPDSGYSSAFLRGTMQ